MMAVNSLTPNMPMFDTLQKNQHSTAYRARQLVRGHRQLRSQSCREHPMAWAPLYVSLEIQFLAESSCSSPGLAQGQQSCHSPLTLSCLLDARVALASPPSHDQTTPAAGTREHEWPHTYTSTSVITLPSVIVSK